MGVTKTKQYTKAQNEMARLFKALAHPARIAIVEFLLKSDKCICNDIVSEVGLAQATVSQHLRELKQAEIIIGEVEGVSICYCLNPDKMNRIKNYIESVFTEMEIKCC